MFLIYRSSSLSQQKNLFLYFTAIAALHNNTNVGVHKNALSHSVYAFTRFLMNGWNNVIIPSSDLNALAELKEIYNACQN